MPTDPQRVQAAFLAAVEITDPAERAKFVADACAGDADLKVRVEALLRAHDNPDSLLDGPAVAPTLDETAAPADEIPLGFLAPPTRPDSLGRIGHYDVLQILGRGGFGIVFRAFDDKLQRVVAVKVLFPQMAATSPARKRFLREARAAAAVRHENVVQVYEVGESPLPYIAMEFIPGETLQQRLDRAGPLDPAEVVRIGARIAEGLAAAHATGLIHRDVKPGNVLIEGDPGKVKLTDFGLARTADDASISHSGAVVGTPMYMAPEQARGEALDQRADLFSLGSLLYQMVTGRPPFRAPTTLAVLRRVAEDAPRPIREVIPETPGWLCDVIAKLHAKNPADRFQTAREVADLLARCERDLAENRRPAPAIPATPPKRRRVVWAVAAVYAATLAVAAAFGYARWDYVNRPAVLTVTSDDRELVVTIDDRLVPLSGATFPDGVKGSYAGSHTLGLRPGAHRLWAMKGGRLVYEREFVITAGEELTIDLAQEMAPPKKAAADPARLQGAWRAVAVERFGRPVAVSQVESGDTAVFAGDRFTKRWNGLSWTAEVVLRPGTSPPALDLRYPGQGVTAVIYRVDGERLVMAFAKPGGPRPTAFTTTPDTEFTVATYARDDTPPAPPAPAGPRVLRAFGPAKDKPVPPPWANPGCVTVEDGAWRIENAERAGNFNVLLATVLDDVPTDGVIVFRARVKVKVKDPRAWGDLMLGVGSPSFYGYDWPTHLGEFRGDVPGWTQKEVRYPAAAFHKKDPPSIPVYVGLHADGVLWVKDAELLHIPADPQKATVLNLLRAAVATTAAARETARHRFEAGVASKAELARAEAELIDARVALAEAEGDAAAVAAGLDDLITNRQEERDLVATRVELGAEAPPALDRANAQLTEAKLRRAKVAAPPRP